jgi:hypothetical protein
VLEELFFIKNYVSASLHKFFVVLLRNPFTTASILSGYLWGGCLAAPGDTLLRPTYKHMHEIASEDVWIFVFFALATLQLWRLYVKMDKQNVPFEVLLKTASAIVWTAVAILCMMAQWPLAAAMSDTFVIAIFAWIDLLNMKSCTVCPFRGSCKTLGCPYDRRSSVRT